MSQPEPQPGSPQVPPFQTATQAAMEFFSEEEYRKRLRDYFAAMALQGLCVNRNVEVHDFEEAITKQAIACYAIADAMLKAREVPS